MSLILKETVISYLCCLSENSLLKKMVRSITIEIYNKFQEKLDVSVRYTNNI